MRRISVLALAALFISATSLNRVQAAAGDLDQAFGSGGKLIVEFFGFTDTGKAIAIQRDGKYVIAGQIHSGSSFDFGVARYNSDGSPDLTFGNGGKVNTDFSTPPVSGIDDPFDIEIQPDGKILVAGSVNNNSVTGEDFGVVRYNADGSLDEAFGSGGKVTTDFYGFGDIAYAVAVQRDGKIVVSGFALVPNTVYDFAVVRYNADGSLDQTFGSGGKVTTDFATFDQPHALALQPDGKIVLGGSSFADSFQSDFALARYNRDGSLDATFGTGGKVTTDFGGPPPFGNFDALEDIAIQRDGRIVAVGVADMPTVSGFGLARYNNDGSLDSSFGQGGKVVTGIGEYSRANVVTIRADGKIVAGGETRESNAAFDSDFTLARYNSDGSPDADFGDGGVVTTEFFGLPDYANDMALQSDGKIILVGSASTPRGFPNIALARYDGGEVFDLCLQDKNGGGILRINSTTGDYQFNSCDGLIVGGTGTLTVRDCAITLRHNAHDRRVMAMVDTCRSRGTATVQTFSPRRTTHITDLDTTGSCGCSE